ncbi:MAG: betaine-aldehyde dehydrogenase, partial [Endozoicomonas sp.]
MILRNFIHGCECASSGEVFDVINPATAKTAYCFESADEQTLEKAIDSAREGFLKWSSFSGEQRQRILYRVSSILRKRNEELARIEVMDTGKPWQEASTVDVASGADVIEYYGGLTTAIEGVQQSLGEDFFYTRREPLGICAGIGAWNYPLQIACWKAGPALASGNAMIFKPSEETPRGAVELAKVFVEAGVPEGVFNVVLGDGRVGQWLTRSEAVHKVSFTGEVQTGARVMANAGATLKEVTMELGGKSPLIIFDDADLDQAVTGAMLGNFYTQGEICTNGTRVFVQKGIYERFMEVLLERTRKHIVCGDPMRPETNLGALISEQHREKVLSYIHSAVDEGASLVYGGRMLSPESAPDGYFVEPTIFTGCKDDMRFCREEIFGPVMAVLRFDK